MFPTKRRIFPRQVDGTSRPEPLVVSIDLLRYRPELKEGTLDTASFGSTKESLQPTSMQPSLRKSSLDFVRSPSSCDLVRQ